MSSTGQMAGRACLPRVSNCQSSSGPCRPVDRAEAASSAANGAVILALESYAAEVHAVLGDPQFAGPYGLDETLSAHVWPPLWMPAWWSSTRRPHGPAPPPPVYRTDAQGRFG